MVFCNDGSRLEVCSGVVPESLLDYKKRDDTVLGQAPRYPRQIGRLRDMHRVQDEFLRLDGRFQVHTHGAE